MVTKAKNSNFRLGLNRSELIEASKLFGKGHDTAKKSSTKALESYLVNKFAGKGAKVPELSKDSLRDIERTKNTFGFTEGIKYAGYKIGKAVGNTNEDSFLRLSLASAFRAYSDIPITSQLLDELERRLPDSEYGVKVSGVVGHKYNYVEMFVEYADELQNE
jgi:hypothetical protein